jgi:hypothetical protein
MITITITLTGTGHWQLLTLSGLDTKRSWTVRTWGACRLSHQTSWSTYKTHYYCPCTSSNIPSHSSLSFLLFQTPTSLHFRFSICLYYTHLFLHNGINPASHTLFLFASFLLPLLSLINSLFVTLIPSPSRTLLTSALDQSEIFSPGGLSLRIITTTEKHGFPSARFLIWQWDSRWTLSKPWKNLIYRLS